MSAYIIDCRNINSGLPTGLALLKESGVRSSSRNGDVLTLPGPVMTVIQNPWERVLFHPERDANPFFHLVESAWMLAGRNDLKQLTPYVKRMAQYSDDGGMTQPAAYGHRWRQHFLPYDQLDWVVERLRYDPGDRRTVIQMWDAQTDMRAADDNSADVPCNLSIMPRIVDGQLQMAVTNRSHDMIWGLFGANAVHFSILQEYLAARLDVDLGQLTFFSNNLHAYVETIMEPWDPDPSPYETEELYDAPATMFGEAELDDKTFKQDLKIFFEHGAIEAQRKARWPWIRRVLAPMAIAHQHWRAQRGPWRYNGALEILKQVEASDWRLAGEQWIQRRQARWLKAQDDGVQHDV